MAITVHVTTNLDESRIYFLVPVVLICIWRIFCRHQLELNIIFLLKAFKPYQAIHTDRPQLGFPSRHPNVLEGSAMLSP